MVVIRPIKKSDSAKRFLDFISELIAENTYILINEKPTLKEEKKWLKEKHKSVKQKTSVFLVAWDGKKLVGECEARRGRWKEKDNVSIGIAILKSYRKKGLGENLLRNVIKLAKKKLKPTNIWLSVSKENHTAQRLYRKVGFQKFAYLPKWMKHKEKYIDEFYMILKK